ncbi:MAG: addiction module protein, partial [Gemmatimonadetes bacterium]|nr:addiction module protein [Gemmatimonadota bacterium]
MPYDPTELRASAVALPVKERGALAERLLASLDPVDDPAAVERAWIEEAVPRARK